MVLLDMKKNTITVYWAPSIFTTNDPSWDMLYTEPKFLMEELNKKNKHDGLMIKCPAIKQNLKNVVSFNSAIDDVFSLPGDKMKNIAFTETALEPIETTSKLFFAKMRKSSMDGFINVKYNMNWTLFADEPLEMRFTAPYFPTASPTENSYLASGQFNIGKWFRELSLDYHIPLESKQFSIKRGQPLFFAEFLTDKKIVMKRFQISPRLKSLLQETAQSTSRYGKFKTLLDRYKMAHDARIPEIVLNEIKKNLID
jgi:hypothetical protein